MWTGSANLLTGWIAILLGIVSGSYIGLYFHRDDWAGGYASFRRRMVRLGHISFIGLGLINIAFGLTLHTGLVSNLHAQLAGIGFVLGAVTMPLFCFLTAWRKPFRHLFAIPVLSVAFGVVVTLLGWT